MSGLAARVSGYFRTMILTSITSDTQPLSAKSLSEWTRVDIASDPQGHLQAWRSHPDGQEIADIYEERYRQQYPHKFSSCPTAFNEPESEPPSSNTGVNFTKQTGRQVVGFDYFTGTGSFQRLDEVFKVIEHFYPGLVLQPSCGRYGYALGYRSDLGLEIYFTPEGYEGAANHGKMTIRVPGEPLAALSPENKLNFLADLYVMNIKPSRIDLKIRDFDKLITPSEILKIKKKSDYNLNDVSGFKKHSFNSSQSSRDKNRECETLYLGSRKGFKYFRVYDAFEKHGLECFDWELEQHNDLAKEVFSKIMEHSIETKDVESTYKMIADIVIGSVNFVHRTDKNVERCKEYAFWTEFKAGFDAIKISVQKVKTTIESTKKWVRKSVVNSLATVVFNGLGISTSEIKEKGFDTVLKEYSDPVAKYLLGLLSEVELKSSHIDRLNAAEVRAQATTSYSVVFQT